tara:strand:- start:42 stop:815 length:774 start_codon:yes stop_codon:yes gene_type:complete
MLKTFDEVVYVDWNTEEGKKIVTDELQLENRDKLRVFHVTPDLVKKITNGTPTPPMCEVLARNIGIRGATGDIIFSVNLDLIISPREQIDLMCQNLKMGDMITLTKQDVELDDLKKHFGDETDIQHLMPIIFGVWPIQKRLMLPVLSMNKELMLKQPEDNHHVCASIIQACGDFQVAHRETWFKIKGFEESMTKRLYHDTNVQYKVIMNGGKILASNTPHIYHIEHERNNSPENTNIIKHSYPSTNDEEWGSIKYIG